VLLAMLAAWTMAAAADLLAFRRNATLGALAPALVLFVWSSTLGTSEHATILVAAFALTAGAFLAIQNLAVIDLRRSWLVSAGGARSRWLLPATAVGIAALVFGVVLAPALPGADRDPLLDLAETGAGRNSSDYSTQIPPLLDVSQKLKQPGNDPVFNVNSPVPDYWRLVALDEFSDDGGGQWTLSAEGSDEVRDDLPRNGPAGSVRQRYDISSLGERWLPAAYRPVAISTPAFVVSSSDTLVSSRDTLQGLAYTVDSKLPPARAEVERAHSATSASVPTDLARYTELPSSVPKSIRDEARRVVDGAGAQTPYAVAEALRNYFWDESKFTYDTSVEPADDPLAIQKFLEDGRGFCVQFASAYAVMARSLGIPARVAVGFTQGDRAGDVYTVRSHDAHAWPELYFEGVGWTHVFDPTPPAGRTSAPGGSLLPDDGGAATQQEEPVTTVAPPVPTQPADPGAGAPEPATTLAPVPPRVSTNDANASPNWWLLALGALAALVVLPALYLLVVSTAKSRRRARRRAADDPAVAVHGAWEEALDRLDEARVPRDPALTPFEIARSAPQHGVTAATRPLRALARAYTGVRYGDGEPAPADVDRAWESVDELDRALDAGAGRRERWRRRLDPSTLRPGPRSRRTRAEAARR
jgi:transglutaminase-like putative cysteine protease